MALPEGIASRDELIEAHAHVMNHSLHFISSMCLKCAIELRIPDIIHNHGKPMTLSDLINALPVNKEKSEGIYRLMRLLIHSKFFILVKITEKHEEKGYWLTPASRLLLRDEPVTMAPTLVCFLDPILMDPWHHLTKWFQDDNLLPFATKHGRAIWEYAAVHPTLNQSFNSSMASDTHLAMRVVVQECKQVFEGLNLLVDVGGGIGTASKAINDAFPGIKCTVLDLPHVVAGLEGTSNLTYLAGDMFGYIPPADAVFMKWILHDWTDEECITILKKCKEAINPDMGKVIIIEMVLGDHQEEDDDHKATENQLYLDMQMMVVMKGKERTWKEWENLFSNAGFTGYKVHPVLGSRSLIEIFP